MANNFFECGNRHYLALGVAITLVYTWVSIFLPMRFIFLIDTSKVLHRTDDKFLSFALDTSFVKNKMGSFSNQDWEKMRELASLFSPCYLRLGGTDSDRVIFSEVNRTNFVIITPQDWERINNFVISSNLRLIFDFNVLLRDQNVWDSKNAREILKFSKQNGFTADYQLGNEPNSFRHVFNFSLIPEQLGKDFKQLRNILNSDRYFETALLVGPDITMPKGFKVPSMPYLSRFLNESIDVIDAVTWHQYYVNGRNATIDDFLNSDIMDDLASEITLVTDTVRSFSKTVPIWLGETGSAYGGGAPNISNRFASIFFLVDKLGLSAQFGIDIVVRQSFYQGHYALIDDSFNPNPDFWVSLLYKKLVGSRVYGVFAPRENKLLRVYAHNLIDSVSCLRTPDINPTVVLFGMNLGDSEVYLKVKGSKDLVHCATYVFTAEGSYLQSPFIQLNGKTLDWNKTKSRVDNFTVEFASLDQETIFPPYSVAFWVFS